MTRTLWTGAAALALAACDGGATTTSIEYLPPTLTVEVSGGVAGAAYAYVLTSDGLLAGVACEAVCDFAPGDTLHVLTPLQAGVLEAALDEVGGWQEGVHDYGVPCCDQFEYRLVFQDAPREGVVRGTSESLPAGFARLVRLLEGMRAGTPPVVVEGAHPVGSVPTDEVEILDASLETPVLTLRVRYVGGCVRHAFDLVARWGWRESDPVQIDADLAHNDAGDTCEALPTETVRFDLTPLREAYRAAYQSDSGAITLFVGAASGGPRTTVVWTF